MKCKYRVLSRKLKLKDRRAQKRHYNPAMQATAPALVETVVPNQDGSQITPTFMISLAGWLLLVQTFKEMNLYSN